MKSRIKMLICFVLVSFLVFAAIPYKQLELRAIDTSKSNEEALKAKLSQYQSEQKELKKKLDSANSDYSAKENEKQYLDLLVFATENEIAASNELYDEYTRKIAEKEVEIEETQADIEEKYQELLGRMEFVYEEENSENYLDMILNSETVSDMLMTVERIGSMLDFDNSLMSELSAKLEALDGEKQALIDTREAQKELKEALKAKQTELQAQIASLNAYISELQADREAYKARMEKAEKAEQQTNAEIEKLLNAREKQREAESKKDTGTNPVSDTDDTLAGGTPTYTGGGFIWPVPASYRVITSRFGVGGHRGIDIPFSYATNVFASKAGTVVTATWHYSYGYYVLIDHGDGSSTLYAHNSRLLVAQGDTVKQGQVIAKGGNTGNSYGNHCHFEVRINGKLVNPLNYVSQP